MADWLLGHYQEILGAITSLIYLYFSVIQSKWLWPLGLVSSAIYAIVFFKSGIYADMGLQVYYVLVSIYGWYHWTHMETSENQNVVPISIRLNYKLILLLFIVSAVLFGFLSWILIHFTDSTIPYVDSFTTALSITATWMLARKYLEHWLIWIVVDSVSIGVYYYKELYFTIILFFIYTIVAVVGYVKWRNNIKYYNLIQVHQSN